MDTTRGDIAVSLREVTKRYPGGTADSVHALSLDVQAGELVALVGPSGCGKTTTLKMINRLIEPTAGAIEILGRDQKAVPAHELRRSIGYVIQQIGLFPHRTIARNIGVVPDLLGWDKPRIAERVAELVALVGLPDDVVDRYPSELSGGQQQRVGVARALAADPPILLMDEPYSAVDPLVREKLQDDLLALQAKVGKTIIIVTHDIDEAIKLGDRVAILAEGGVLAQYASPDDLLRAPADAFVAAFLGRERGLRRLGLRRVRDLHAATAVCASTKTSVAEALAAAETARASWVVAAQPDGEVLLAGVDALRSHNAAATLAAMSTAPALAPDAPLREALDAVLRSEARAAVVPLPDGGFGVVTLDLLAEELR